MVIKRKSLLLVRLCILLILLAFGAFCVINAMLFPDGIVVSLLRATDLYVNDPPDIFGGFHIFMLLLCVVLTALTVFVGSKIKNMRIDSVVFGFGVFFFLLELYKQLYWYAVIGNGHYNFGILPLQLCSYCLYLCLLIPLLPDGKLKEALYGFLALYQTMGGCIVMAYPAFYYYVSLTAHTIVWHIAMVVLGFLVLSKKNFGRSFLREMALPSLVFLATFGLSIALNILITPYTVNSVQPLNLFYMSPYEPCKYFLIGDVREALGWGASLVCYGALFVFLGATTLWGIGWLFDRLFKSKKGV